MSSSIWEQVAAGLAPLGVPLAANVYQVATGAQLPDLYIVYQLISDTGALYGNDLDLLRTERVQVTIWSRDGLANLPDVSGALRSAGFTRGPGRELPRSQDTGHYGLALDFYHLTDEE